MPKPLFTLITGASEGLGKALAMECAARGMHLVLVALPGSGLKQTAAFIRRHFTVNVYCMETDLSDEASCYRLYKATRAWGIRIRILINNAGVGGTFYFTQRETTCYSQQIRINTLAPTLLCRLFLDDLLSTAPAYILNVSSLAAKFTLPKKQVYGATKSYLLYFSRSLRRELRGRGVYVSALCPGGINTSWRLMLSNRTGTWLSRQSVMTPQEVARAALAGLLRKKECIVPGRINRCLLYANRLCPSWLREWLTGFQMRRYQAEVQVLPKVTGIVTATQSTFM